MEQPHTPSWCEQQPLPAGSGSGVGGMVGRMAEQRLERNVSKGM